MSLGRDVTARTRGALAGLRAASGGGVRPFWRAADEDDPILPPLGPALAPVLAPGEAVALPPMDETPNSPETDAPTRVPHIGHALLFVAITGLLLLLAQAVLLGMSHPALGRGAAAAAATSTEAVLQPKRVIAVEAFTYLGTILAAAGLFPLLWKRPFGMGIEWNSSAAVRNLYRLIPLGVVVSFVVQGLSAFLPTPKSIPMDDFFRTQSDVWLITVFGTLAAPAFEEILFRGFLFPAFAIAYDWLSLPRTETARESWRSSNALTGGALLFSAVFSSILFALLHGKQIAFTWPVLFLLFLVSLLLTYVRVRLRSVAASTVVHASYNFAIFLTAFLATGGYRHLDRLPH